MRRILAVLLVLAMLPIPAAFAQNTSSSAKPVAQDAYDAVTAGVDLADQLAFACGFDDTGGGGVDDRGNATRLSVKGILASHGNSISNNR